MKTKIKTTKPSNGAKANRPTTFHSFNFYLIFFLSGAAGLGYEIIWTRMFGIGLGNEVASMLGVVAAFFGGFALGAKLLDRSTSTSRRPGMYYAALEVLIGVWALVTLFLIPLANAKTANLIGINPSVLRHWSVAFAVPFACLLPATAAMGATLSAMDRFLAGHLSERRAIGGLYAANTLGAVAGTLLSAFVLIPTMGNRATIILFALSNFLCAGLAMKKSRRQSAVAEVSKEVPMRDFAGESAIGRGRLLLTLFATGLLGIGYEVLGVWVVAQITDNTVYSFASTLAVYLAGTAVGASVYQRWCAGRTGNSFLSWMLQGLCIACMLGIIVMRASYSVRYAIYDAVGRGFNQTILVELMLAAMVFLPSTILMGMTFSHLAQHARRAAGGVGTALSMNTLGGAIAPILFGVILLPNIGAKWALVCVAVLYLFLIPRFNRAQLLALVVPFVIFFLLPRDLHLIHPLPGGHVITYKDGIQAAVAVVDDPQGALYLKVNDHFIMGGNAHRYTHLRMGHLPLLLHPNPHQVLFLGLGAGTTMQAAAWHPKTTIDGVELLPEVIEVLPYFTLPEDRIDTRTQTIYKADARRYVRACHKQYDLIVADLYHPARDGSGSLYTSEHFKAVAGRLAPGGIFCQWLPLYQMDQKTFQIIARTFLNVFPSAHAILAEYTYPQTPAFGLVGQLKARAYAPDYFSRRVQDPDLAKSLDDIGLKNNFQLLGCYLGGRAALEAYAGPGPLNTDDHPLVTFTAPKADTSDIVLRQADTFLAGEYARRPTPLLEIIERLKPTANEILRAENAPTTDSAATRLENYWQARNHFIRSKLLIQENPKSEEALPELMKSVKASPDFTEAYDAVFNAASKHAGDQPEMSRQMIDTLIEYHPQRREAVEWRERHP